MHLLRLALVTGALTLALAAPRRAGAQSDSAKVIREYRGTYQRGFEHSWFSACGAPRDDSMWWVTLTDEAMRQRDSLLAKVTAPKTNGLAVRWKGTVGARMPAGTAGRGTRYMLVTSIEEIWPLPSEGACANRIAS
jgi:hypothetical protein